MFEQDPRDEAKHWLIDEHAEVKPGDTVLVKMVWGKKFGELESEHLFGQVVVYLGSFDDETQGLIKGLHLLAPDVMAD